MTERPASTGNGRERLCSLPPRPRTFHTVAAFLFALAWAALGSRGDASAHALPDHASPPINGFVTAHPARVEIWFTEEATSATTITVIGPDGSRVDLGDSKLDLYDINREHVTVSLRAGLQAGAYTVQWRSVSGQDGDAAQGAYTFTIGAGTPIASPVATPLAVASTPPARPSAAASATPSPVAGGNFDSGAFVIAALAGIAAVAGIYLFWRFVRPKHPVC